VHVRAVDLDGGLEEVVERESALLDVNFGLGGVAVDVGVINDFSDAGRHMELPFARRVRTSRMNDQTDGQFTVAGRGEAT
jgi:hypothetical protein